MHEYAGASQNVLACALLGTGATRSSNAVCSPCPAGSFSDASGKSCQPAEGEKHCHPVERRRQNQNGLLSLSTELSVIVFFELAQINTSSTYTCLRACMSARTHIHTKIQRYRVRVRYRQTDKQTDRKKAARKTDRMDQGIT